MDDKEELQIMGLKNSPVSNQVVMTVLHRTDELLQVKQAFQHSCLTEYMVPAQTQSIPMIGGHRASMSCSVDLTRSL